MTKRDATAYDIMLITMAGLAAGSLMVMNTASLIDGDTAWHVAAGQWIIKHGRVPTTDPFSFTAHGRAWTTQEWLTEVAMYLAYRAAGWSGVMILYAGALAATFGLLAGYLRSWVTPPKALVLLMLCAVGIQQSLLARPHVFGWIFLTLWLINLMRAVDNRKSPPLWLALLMVVWANVHASSIFGLLLIGPFALEGVIRTKGGQRRSISLKWVAFIILCGAAAIMTPSGYQTILYPFQVAGMSSLKFINDWQPTKFGQITSFEIVLMSGLFFCLYKPVQVPWIRLIVLLGVLHMALSQWRHQAIFSIIATIILAAPMAKAYSGADQQRFKLKEQIASHAREFVPIFLVVFALFGGVIALALTMQKTRLNTFNTPLNAISAIPAALRSKPVFNEWSFGGSLILEGIPVYIDGRNDMYGDAHATNYVAIFGGDRARWEAAQKKWNIAWTILPPDGAITKIIDADPQWRRIYADDHAVIHVSRERTAGLDLTLSGAHPAAVGQVHPVGQEQVRKP